MSVHVPLLSSIVKYYLVFKHYTGKRFFLLTAITFIAGLAESFGIMLFLPLITKTSIAAEGTDRVSRIVNAVFSWADIAPTLGYLSVLIIFIFILKGILKFAEGTYKAHLTATIMQDARQEIITACTAMRYRHYLNKNIGFFTNLISLETSRLVSAFGRYCNIVIKVIMISVYLAFSFWLNWQFSIITVMFGVSVMYGLRSFTHATKSYSFKTSRGYTVLHGLLIHALQAFKYMKATNSFPPLHEKLSATIRTLSRLQFKTIFMRSILEAFAEPLIVCFLLGLVFVQITVVQGSLAPIFVTIVFFYRIVQHIMSLQREWQGFSSFIGGVESVRNATREITANEEQTGEKPCPPFRNAVSIENVSFAYGEKNILQDITLRIEKNTAVAFVGQSGSGKTTLADLITGILEPNIGSISVDGVSLKACNCITWRRQIGYVTQDPILFNDTIANNISLWEGEDTHTRKRIIESARRAHCDAFIHELPQRYDTLVGDRGTQVSGGQRQRIAIARELYKNPGILLLDEATSALDTESEMQIQKSIDELKGSMTVILIAHRISTIRNADYIYVLQEGRIVEQGTFKQLNSAKGSVFKRMCDLQNLNDSGLNW